MKKKGYTLAEALVAMGVIGVVAALMLPLMNKYKPDAEKALFIRTYDAIVESLTPLVSDDTIYKHKEIKKEESCEDDISKCNYYDYSKAPLLNSSDYTDDFGEKHSFDNESSKKLGWAMAKNLHGNFDNDGTIKLINKVEIQDIKYNQHNKAFEVSVKLPNSKYIFPLYIMPNGIVIPNTNDGNTKNLEYLASRSNWKKSGEINKEVLKDISERNEETYKYWQKNAVMVERTADGKIYTPES